MKAAIIGFGEAGPVFADAFVAAGWHVSAFDILPQRAAAARALSVRFARDHQDAAAGADLVLSTVTASEALAAARACAPALHAGQTFLDLNSVAPATKAQIQSLIAPSDADFVEAVAMDTVPQCGAAVPLLLCGPGAGATASLLNSAGLNATDLGDRFGAASTTKLVRSILIKGLEALFAEVAEIGEKAGVTQTVLASVQRTFPGLDWEAVAGYHLNRMATHGARRAAEMRACAGMLSDAGLDSALTDAIAAKHQSVADRASPYEGTDIADFVASLKDG